MTITDPQYKNKKILKKKKKQIILIQEHNPNSI